MERGDVVTDPNGVEWRIVEVFIDNRRNPSQVRVGSLAEQIIFGPDKKEDRTNGEYSDHP